jgi:phage-related minor tail protein
VAGANSAGRAIESALMRAVTTGKFGMEDLKRAALSVMADIARAAIGSGLGALGIGGGSGSSSGGGVGFGGLASVLMSLLGGAPGRATGGPVSAGRAYRVGERGPEYFVPTSSGRVDPGAGGGRSTVINVHIQGGGGDDRVRMAQTGRQLARAVSRAIAESER